MAGAEPVPPAAAGAPRLQVLLVASPAPRVLIARRLELPAGSTVAQALDAVAAGAEAALRALLDAVGATVQVSVHGRKVPPGRVLHEGDRIELCRPLQVDPKEARRQRYQAQGGRKRPRGYTPPSRPRPEEPGEKG